MRDGNVILALHERRRDVREFRHGRLASALVPQSIQPLLSSLPAFRVVFVHLIILSTEHHLKAVFSNGCDLSTLDGAEATSLLLSLVSVPHKKRTRIIGVEHHVDTLWLLLVPAPGFVY